MHREKPSELYDVRIDRGHSPLANKFRMESEKDRDKVCDQYDKWLEGQLLSGHRNKSVVVEILRLQKIYKRYGILRLFCWCAPLRCHGETVAKYIVLGEKDETDS